MDWQKPGSCYLIQKFRSPLKPLLLLFLVVWRKYCTYLINQQNDIYYCSTNYWKLMQWKYMYWYVSCHLTWWTCCCCHLLLNFYFEIHAHVCVYMHPRMNAALETLKRLQTLEFNWEDVRVVFQIWHKHFSYPTLQTFFIIKNFAVKNLILMTCSYM